MITMIQRHDRHTTFEKPQHGDLQAAPQLAEVAQINPKDDTSLEPGTLFVKPPQKNTLANLKPRQIKNQQKHADLHTPLPKPRSILAHHWKESNATMMRPLPVNAQHLDACRVPLHYQDAAVYVFKRYVNQKGADELFYSLQQHPTFATHVVKKLDSTTGELIEVVEGRPTCNFSEPAGYSYIYNGADRLAEKFPEAMKLVKKKIEVFLKPLLNAAEYDGFNHCLANKYENGKQGVGFHSHDEPDSAEGGPIACISVGAERTFEFREIPSDRPWQEGDERLAVRLEHGDLIVMSGACQQRYVHSVLKESAVQTLHMSFTFRTSTALAEGLSIKATATSGVPGAHDRGDRGPRSKEGASGTRRRRRRSGKNIGSESEPSMPMVGSEPSVPMVESGSQPPVALEAMPASERRDEPASSPQGKASLGARKRCFSLQKRLQKMDKTKEKIAQGQQVEQNQLAALAEYQKTVALLAEMEEEMEAMEAMTLLAEMAPKHRAKHRANQMGVSRSDWSEGRVMGELMGGMMS